MPEDLVAMLDLLADTIVQALGFGVALINIALPDGSLEVVSVAGDEGARTMLLGTTDSAAVWDQMLAVSEPWGLLRFADHSNDAAYGDMLSWVPEMQAVEADDAWHPEDALFAPLTAADGALIGVLSVDLPANGLRPDAMTCRALEAFAVSTALAIEHSTLRAQAQASEQRFRDIATHDALTGVGTRAVLFERLQHALSVRPQHRSLLALAFIDLDGFKLVNDSHGHAAGDELLTVVASRISVAVRPHDTVVRWGGDEFLVLLEHLDGVAAGREVARRIASAIAEPMTVADRELSITASLGLAFAPPEEAMEPDELVRRADAAMYGVKRDGQEACAVYEPVPAPMTHVSAQGG